MCEYRIWHHQAVVQKGLRPLGQNPYVPKSTYIQLTEYHVHRSFDQIVRVTAGNGAKKN